MAEATAIQLHESEGFEGGAALRPVQISDLVARVNFVREVMRCVMIDKVHYGVIPGCGERKVLLKGGADVLRLAYGLTPKIEKTVTDLPGGHREVSAECSLFSSSNICVGQGFGSCSTMETKYRYRTGPSTPTGKPVPKEYWDLRKSDPGRAKAILGGDGYSTKKIDNRWEIVQVGERVENPDPADQYNTVLKMAVKRAYVAAVITATSTSDILDQDLEEEFPDIAQPVQEMEPPAPPAVPMATQEQIQRIRELTGGDRKKLEELTTGVDSRGKVIPGVRDPNVMTMEQAERALERGAK